MREIQKEFEKRFVPDPKTGCWMWIKNLNSGGYGQFGKRGAHRASYEIYKGKIKGDKWVLHKCDTPACVNPDHLWLGNRSENMRDMVAKKRFKTALARNNEKKTHCIHGHKYDAKNTMIRADGRGRECRACKMIRLKSSRPYTKRTGK